MKLGKIKTFSKCDCSTSFLEAFAVSADNTLTADCLCGRTHFASADEGCFDSGELDRLREKHSIDPNRYVEHPDESSVASSNFYPGHQFVLDCPCGYSGFLESVLWRRKVEVAQFLRLRADAEHKIASAMNVLAVGVAQSIGV